MRLHNRCEVSVPRPHLMSSALSDLFARKILEQQRIACAHAEYAAGLVTADDLRRFGIPVPEKDDYEDDE